MKYFSSLLVLILLSTASLGQNQNLSQGNVFDGEPYLAINPNNAQHLVVAWMGWVNVANRFKIKVKASFDGGQTWSAVSELPHTVASYSSADPCVAFNHKGDVFVSYIDFTGTNPPVTGGVYLCKSSNGGLSWDAPLEVISTTYDPPKWPIDRPWMAIDRSQGPHQGTIYITSMNLNRNNPGYNPYLSVSADDGNSFTTRLVDTTGWLAGSINQLPMCSPLVSADGTFYGTYPSYVITQSLYAQQFMARSNNGGISLNHSLATTFNPPTNLQNYSLAKKAAILIGNPADAKHLAFIYLADYNGDIDVYLIETKDAGISWSAPLRINDDPVANGRMQDLIWGDFDADGDLIVSWRDRRNGNSSSFKTPSEIWAAYRRKDSVQFEPNFEITSQTPAYDSILERSGNDFMCIALLNDTLNATWGDARDGKLNIWFQRMTTNGSLVSIQQIASEEIPQVAVFPNPTYTTLFVEAPAIREVKVYDLNGKELLSQKESEVKERCEVSLAKLPTGHYLIEVRSSAGKFTTKIFKEE